MSIRKHHHLGITTAILILYLSAWHGEPILSAQGSSLALNGTYLRDNAVNTPLSTIRRTIFSASIECPTTTSSCAVRIESSAFVESIGTNVWARVDVDDSISGIYPRDVVKLTSGEGPSSPSPVGFPSYTGVRTFSVYKWHVPPGVHTVHVQLFTERGNAWFLNGLMTVDVYTR